MKNWVINYHAQGHLAEFLAAWALRLKGYRILRRRYKTPLGEIDLIAARGKTLVAVEVKYRSCYTQAVEAITAHQQRRIERALACYLQRLQWTPENIRFDAILLSPYKWPRHLVSAWRANSHK